MALQAAEGAGNTFAGFWHGGAFSRLATVLPIAQGRVDRVSYVFWRNLARPSTGLVRHLVARCSSGPRRQALAGPAASGSQVVVERVARHLCQFEPDGSAGLALPGGRAVDGVAIRRHVVDAQRRQIAVAQLLSMARLKRVSSRVRRSSSNLARMDHTWPGRSGGLEPVSLPLL